MTDQEPVQDALYEAAASLMRTLGVILLIIVVPTVLLELIKDKDAKKSQRVMMAMMQMTKLDIAALERAAAGS